MKNTKKRFSSIFLLSLGVAILIALVFDFGFLKNIERMSEDALYQNVGTIPTDIKIIAIDEETLVRLGSYSNWDRTYFANLIEILNKNEEKAPKIIGIDIIFSGSNGQEGDKLLVDTVKKYDNLYFSSSITVDNYFYKNDGKYQSAQYISGEGKPYDELAAVTDYGFTNAIFDEDGVIRRFYTCITSVYNNVRKDYYSFPYGIASKVGASEKLSQVIEIAFTGKPGEFETISMVDVLDGNIPTGYFEDCIVLIGAYEEGMMDSYKVPIDYSVEMYGVEIHANCINAILNDGIIYNVNSNLQFLITVLVISCYFYYALNTRMRNSVIGMIAVIITYILTTICVRHILLYKMNIIAAPIGVILTFFIALIYKYIQMQNVRNKQMRNMLFSMSEAMAEAIEGRTPYNANHTKNVAQRCLEMIDFINKKHREKKTDMFFSGNDKQQLYLAAMLHDVGKMVVPLKIMDKPTKLGSKEKELRSRLEIISLRIENDALQGYISREKADQQIDKIKIFIDNLDSFNTGRPLKEDELILLNDIAESIYCDKDGNEIPYLTKEENENLHIKAGTLSENERSIMQNHVVYTDRILSHVQFGEQFKDVHAMASNHHEFLNGMGYPKKIDEKEINNMTRILTIMDIYDSLIADDRPYKKAKSVKVAFEILDEEAEAGKIDKVILGFAKELYLKENE